MTPRLSPEVLRRYRVHHGVWKVCLNSILVLSAIASLLVFCWPVWRATSSSIARAVRLADDSGNLASSSSFEVPDIGLSKALSQNEWCVLLLAICCQKHMLTVRVR